MPTIQEVAALLEAWAPLASAQSYDNVGLQVGDPVRTVERGLIALDLTPAVLDEAQRLKANLIITHHPSIFQPIRAVTAADSLAALPFHLAESGIAHYAIHTNLDAAVGGVSFALGEALDLQNLRFLQPLSEVLHKVVVFVPANHANIVRSSMADAGAGRIGEYDSCAFATSGEGMFKAGAGASPFIGEAGGELERVDEIRLEVEVPHWDLDAVVDAMKSAHPYEEVAFDVYDVKQRHSRTGLGALGVLAEPILLKDFLSVVASNLKAPALRYTGDVEATIQTVAVCGGAGSDLIAVARKAGADAYVTADVTYHKFFDVLDRHGAARMALIDAGHYETEAITETLLQKFLTEKLPEIEWNVTARPTNPVSYFTVA